LFHRTVFSKGGSGFSTLLQIIPAFGQRSGHNVGLQVPMHKDVHKPAVINLGERAEPGREIGWAMAWELSDFRPVLPRIEEKQLPATDPDGFLD
jgi:hypothetical protein